MPNSTDIFWEVDGVSLNTYAWNIETLAGRMTPPPIRGTNLVIPHRAGQIHMPKFADARTVPLGMWVIGKSPEELQKNWRKLQQLLWRAGEQFTLTRRMKIDGHIRKVQAQAEFTSGMEPTMIGPKGAKFTVNLTLVDPYYYDEDYTYIALKQGMQRIDVLGDVPTTKIKVRAIPGTSSLFDFSFRNTANNITIQYSQDNVPISSSDLIEIDVDNYTAYRNTNDDVEQYVSSTGSTFWMRLEPGHNMIDYNTNISSLTKEVQLMYKAAWL